MRAMAIRFLIYGGALLYLALDLFVFTGPLRKKIDSNRLGSEESIALAKAQGLAARAYTQPIYGTQVTRAVENALFREGRNPDDVLGNELEWRRVIATEQLLDEALLRNKIHHNEGVISVTQEEVEAEVARFANRFRSQEELLSALSNQGIAGMDELRLQSQARLEQVKYLELKVKDASAVSETEARSFFQENEEAFTVPEQVNVRHIFFEQIDRSGEAAEALARDTAGRLLRGESFNVLAGELSNDPQTRARGGDLGWVARGRIDAAFTEELFLLKQGEVRVVQSKIGWHVVELMERDAARVPSFSEVSEDIISALSSDRRRQAVEQYKLQLRYSAGLHREFFDQ